jgi:hypothetical protein
VLVEDGQIYPSRRSSSRRSCPTEGFGEATTTITACFGRRKKRVGIRNVRENRTKVCMCVINANVVLVDSFTPTSQRATKREILEVL